jgi:hypothetical protein
MEAMIRESERSPAVSAVVLELPIGLTSGLELRPAFPESGVGDDNIAVEGRYSCGSSNSVSCLVPLAKNSWNN